MAAGCFFIMGQDRAIAICDDAPILHFPPLQLLHEAQAVHEPPLHSEQPLQPTTQDLDIAVTP